MFIIGIIVMYLFVFNEYRDCEARGTRAVIKNLNDLHIVEKNKF